jgi:hypothetical protein
MREPKSLEEKLNKMSQAVKPDEAFSEQLWHEIENSTQKEKRPKIVGFLVKKPALSFVSMLVAALLVFTAMQPQMVMAAFKGLFEYLPGIGFIEDADLAKSIAAPIELTEGGLTIVVDQAVADTNKTIVSYELTADTSIEAGFNECFYSINRLKLSNGADFMPIGGGVSGHSARVEFMALPEGELSPTLYIERDDDEYSKNCTAPKSLSVALPFTDSISAEALAEVFESDQIRVVDEATESMSVEAEGNEVQNVYGIDLVVDRLVDLDNGHTIYGHAEWTNAEITGIFLEEVSITDAAGKDIPVQYTDEGNSDSDFSFVIMGDDWVSPLTLTAEKVFINYQPVTAPAFVVDSSKLEEVGQSLAVDKTFDVSGKSFAIESVEKIKDERSDNPLFVFDVKIDPSIHSINLGLDQDGGGNFPGYSNSVQPIDENKIRVTFGSSQDFAGKEIPFIVDVMNFYEKGLWSVQWNIPE